MKSLIKASEVEKISGKITDLLVTLPSPRDAALALCLARARLHIAGGGESESRVRQMIRNDDDAVLQAWSIITGKALSS